MTGGLDLFAVQESLTDLVRDTFPELTVETGGIPTAESLPLTNGVLIPYIILRFSDSMPAANGGTFSGPRHDELYGYMDALCLAGDDVEARKLATYVGGELLGAKVANAGSLSKIFGGGKFAIYSEANRMPVAFVASVSFRFPTNVNAVGEFS